MLPIHYACPVIFPPALLQRDNWQLSLSLTSPFSHESRHDSSLVLKILDFEVFDTFHLRRLHPHLPRKREERIQENTTPLNLMVSSLP